MLARLENEAFFPNRRLGLAVELLQGIGRTEADNAFGAFGVRRKQLNGQGAVGQSIADARSVSDVARRFWRLPQGAGDRANIPTFLGPMGNTLELC